MPSQHGYELHAVTRVIIVRLRGHSRQIARAPTKSIIELNCFVLFRERWRGCVCARPCLGELTQYQLIKIENKLENNVSIYTHINLVIKLFPIKISVSFRSFFRGDAEMRCRFVYISNSKRFVIAHQPISKHQNLLTFASHCTITLSSLFGSFNGVRRNVETSVQAEEPHAHNNNLTPIHVVAPNAINYAFINDT